MYYQLNLHLSREKKDYFWLFRSEENTMEVFNEVISTFRQYEPKNTALFMEEVQHEIDETGSSDTVQIEVVKADERALIRSAAYKEMWYDDKYFKEIYQTLTDRLGVPEEESIA